MLFAEYFLPDFQCAQEKRLRLCKLLLREIKKRQIVQSGGSVGMFGPEFFFSNVERAFVERLCFQVLPLLFIERRQINRVPSASGRNA
jgi:hypothetical protein